MMMILTLLVRPALTGLLLLLWQETGAPPFDNSGSGGATSAGGAGASLFVMMFQTLLALGLVCGLAYALFRWVLPRLQAARTARSMVRVVDRTPLDARKSLYVIEVAGRWILLASSEAGVQLICELEAEEAAEALAAVERLRPTLGSIGGATREALAGRLARLMNRRR